MTVVQLKNGRCYGYERDDGEDVYYIVTKKPIWFDQLPKEAAHMLVDLVCETETARCELTPEEAQQLFDAFDKAKKAEGAV